MSIVGFDFFGILSFCGYGLVVEAAVGVVGVGVVESGVVSVGVGVAEGVPVGGADHWGLVNSGDSGDSRDSLVPITTCIAVATLHLLQCLWPTRRCRFRSWKGCWTRAGISVCASLCC